MFPNNGLPNNNSTTNTNTLNLDNNCFDEQDNCCYWKLRDSLYSTSKVVVITKHLSIPCPRLYTDIFKTILIVCKDPSHTLHSSQEDTAMTGIYETKVKHPRHFQGGS